MMLRTLIAFTTLISTMCAAEAADIYQPAGASFKDGPLYAQSAWAGFYTGFNGGYGFGPDQAIDYYFVQASPPATSHVPSFDKLQQEGGLGGAQLGHNWQAGHLVYGLETDFQLSGISGSQSAIVPSNPQDRYGLKSNLDWFGTFRGRLGYGFGPSLLYATGGLAYGKVENAITYQSYWPKNCCGFPGFAYGSTHGASIETGYVVGGGVEYLLTPKFTLKVEYQYIDLGTRDAGTEIYYQGPEGLQLHAKADDNYQTVRAGVNYHIGDVGYEPLK